MFKIGDRVRYVYNHEALSSTGDDYEDDLRKIDGACGVIVRIVDGSDYPYSVLFDDGVDLNEIGCTSTREYNGESVECLEVAEWEIELLFDELDNAGEFSADISILL